MTDESYAYSASSVVTEEISIKRLTANENDKGVDIRGNISYFELIESIYDNTMHGSIGIIDSTRNH